VPDPDRDDPERAAELPQPVPEPPRQEFRPSDNRPSHDDTDLARRGIHLYESRHLKLYTDLDPRLAATLPPVIDKAYRALVDYFGELPPAASPAEFQVTGYLILDEARFQESGLIPGDLPPFEHGRHRDYEFWMRDQPFDYYRRHLMIHEFTHCFMTIRPRTDAPVWYMEGMAECFGTHRIGPDGTIQFRVMPEAPAAYPGWGRITAIRNEYAAGRARTLAEILEYRAIEFLKPEHYAWSWALAAFFDQHPRYQKRFRELGKFLQENAFPQEFLRTFGPEERDLATEWLLFVDALQPGYDLTRAAIRFESGKNLPTDAEARVSVRADAGWQSSGVHVVAGTTYEISASGQFRLADHPKPWISEPQGISFHYCGGVPVGRLLGCIRPDQDEDYKAVLEVHTFGRHARWVAPLTGTLYLRLNDDWNSLHDNQGSAEVTIRHLAD